MKSFPVVNLESDCYFTERAYLDDKYILLSPETPVTTRLINRLKRWKFAQIRSDGALVDAPTVSDSATVEGTSLSIDQDVREQSLFNEAKAFYFELATFVEKTFTNFVTRNELAERPIGDMVKQTIDMVRSHRRHILRLADMEAKGKNYIVNHSAKTAILSVAVGLVIRMPPHKLIELGTAAVLHEIGMIRLPPQLYMSNKELTDQERKAITAHTVLGFKILKQSSFPMSVSLAVLECRENADGSGYPRALTADRISQYGKVLMVAGSYAALTSVRPYREPTDGHAAILDMLKRKGQMYDETILRALVANLSVFPVGTYVELANGTRGMVIDNDLEHPMTPKVRIIAGPSGELYAEQQIVDTATTKELRIARAITADDVQKSGRSPA
ncbi:MAG: HD domain-containing protein [Spirochaetales bacterium]|nr:HD domain-containing protein [Spirochaetales bacterium]